MAGLRTRGLPPRERRLSTRFAMLLVLFALSVRLFVPQGYMVTPAADGVIRISLCTGQGAVEVGLSRDGEIVELPEEERPVADGSKCPFALALTPALDAPPQHLLAPGFAAERATTTAVQHQRPGLGLAAPPPPSQGPPPLLT